MKSILSALFFAFCSLSAAGDRPNIILIMCDDVGYSDMGCYGSEINTPNIARLAAAGLAFTNYHTAGSCALRVLRLEQPRAQQRLRLGRLIRKPDHRLFRRAG